MICEESESLPSLLTKITNPRDNAELKMAESLVSSLLHRDDFFESLLLIACDGQYHNNVRLLACTYLKKYVEFVLTRPQQQKLRFVQRVIQFSRLDLSLQLRRTALQAITALFNRVKTDGQRIRQFFYGQLLKALKSLNTSVQNQPQLVINMALCSLMTLSVKYDQLSYQLLNQMMTPWSNILAYTYQQVKTCLSSASNPDVVKWLPAAQLATQVFKKCFSNEDFPRNQIFKQLLISNTLFQTLNAILKLRTTNLLAGCLIEVDGSNQSKYINQMKANMLTVLDVFLKCSLYFSRQNPQNVSQYLVLQYPRMFITSLDMLSKSVRITEINCSIASKIVHLMLLCLSTMVEIPQHYEYFRKECDSLLEHVLMPFYELTDSLKKQYVEDPQQFIAYIQQSFQRSSDCDAKLIDKEQDVMHKIVGKLLMKLCLFLDGVLSRVVSMCIGQLQKNTHEIKALMVIGVLNSKILERKDILKRLYDYFQLEIQQWCGSQQYHWSMSIKLLVISKFVCYFSQLDKNFEVNIQEVCQKILNADQTNSTLGIVSLILLGSLNLSSSVDIINQMISLVNSPQSSRYVLSSLLDYVKDFKKLNEHPFIMVECVSQLVNKICSICSGKEQKNLRKSQIDCWNIIKQIVYVQKIDNKVLQQIQELLIHTLRFLTQPKQFDFEQDILIVLIRCMNTRKSISKTQHHFIQYIPHIIQKYKGSFHRLFQFIQCLFLYGHDMLRTELSSLNTILDVCLVLVDQPVDKYKTETQVAKALLIIHNILLGHHDQMSQQLHLRIIRAVHTKLLKQQEITHCFLQQMYAATLCLSLSLSLTKIQHQMEQVLQMVLSQCCKIQKEYPRKVYVVSLCRLIKMFGQNQLINQYFKQLFYYCITTAYKTEEIKKIHEDSSRDEQLSGDEDKSEEEEDYDKAIALTHNSIKIVNQFHEISTIVTILREERPAQWTSLMSQLSDQTKNQIKILARVQLINNKPRQIIKIRR